MSQVELTTLGESCEFFNGKAHEKDIDVDGKYIVVNSKFISQEGRVIKRTKEQMFPLYKGDIVMVMSDVPNGKALAKCFIIDQDDTYSLNQRICCIRSKEFDTKYLYYQLNRHEHFLAFNNGENQTNLRKGDILDCPLIKPSMDEQKRLVAELDEAYSKLSAVKSNAIKNIQNATDIFNSYLQDVIEKKGVGWKIKKLGEVVEVLDNLRKPITKSDRIDGDYPYYGATGVLSYVHDYIFSEKLVLIGEDGAKWESGDNTSFIAEGKYWVNNHAHVIRPNRKLIIDEWIVYVLNYSDLTPFISGMTVPKLNQGKLRNIPLPIPPLAEQQHIVSVLDALRSETLKLEALYQLKRDGLEELRSCVLKRAFEIELVNAE